jgi:hypothetical protein
MNVSPQLRYRTENHDNVPSRNWHRQGLRTPRMP